MSDLISRSALARAMGVENAVKYGNETAEQQHNSYDTLMKYEIADYIDDAPDVDAVPVVHGRNIRTAGRKYRDFHCSVCGAGACNVEGGTLDGGFFNYCPNCGAKMDGGAEA